MNWTVSFMTLFESTSFIVRDKQAREGCPICYDMTNGYKGQSEAAYFLTGDAECEICQDSNAESLKSA